MEIPYAGLNHELILRLRPSRLKRLSLHTQAVTPTQPVTEHTNILTGLSQFYVGHFPSACPCYKLSITPSLSHRTAFAYYCLLLIVIYISADTELHHFLFLFFKRILCTCKFWMLVCVIWLWLLFKMLPKWGTCFALVTPLIRLINTNAPSTVLTIFL